MQNGIKFSYRFWLIYFLAWIPYALSYIAVFLTQLDTGIFSIFRSMLRNILPAALLGICIIWVLNRINWSLHKKIWFFPAHILLATVYSLIWTGTLFLLLTIDISLRNGVWTPITFVGKALQWQVFSGLMIYATIASIIYVLQVVRNLREEESRAARAETLYAQTSLAALQAQLNPHFLFNTLHSLMALIRYDAEKAETALEKLAEMLRYSLKEKKANKNYLVPLRDEIKFVENYLELEKLRLGERLAFRKEIEKSTLDCLIPAFTIQPLVENSIKHGIAPKNISATIFVSVKREDEKLKIEVSDTGIGSENGNYKNADGVGIKLVREQLQINYAEKSVFQIETKLNEGFRVLIKIPAESVGK